MLLPLLQSLSQGTSCGVEACIPFLVAIVWGNVVVVVVVVVVVGIGAHLDCCQDPCSATIKNFTSTLVVMDCVTVVSRLSSCPIVLVLCTTAVLFSSDKLSEAQGLDP